MRYLLQLSVLLTAACLVTGCSAAASQGVIDVAVADLRAQPGRALTYDHDKLQESQLLFGERVRIIERKDGWLRVEAVEQAEFTHTGRWTGYPGWIPADSVHELPVPEPSLVVTAPWTSARSVFEGPKNIVLPMGTMVYGYPDPNGRSWAVALHDNSLWRIPLEDAASLWNLKALPEAERRALIVDQASKLLGNPYFWGGRSPYNSHSTQITGVDCSGLVNLAYRSAGLIIPRDAHEQYMRARPIEQSQLKPADLVFLSSRNDPYRMVHVMLYAGSGRVVEAPGTGQRVRRIELSRRFAVPLERLQNGTQVDGQTLWYGRLFPQE